MGLRSLEKRLGPEICYGFVAEAVDDYLRLSKEKGHLLNPFDHLKMPILREGFNPPGLHEAVQEVASLRLRRRGQEKKRAELESVPSASDSDEKLELPDADELIEKIFSPYDVGRIRAHHRRRARADLARDRSIGR